MTTGYGLSAHAIELYNLLIAYGWTPERSYTFAQKYDLAYQPNALDPTKDDIKNEDFARVIDDTITQLEQEYETTKAEAITKPYEYKEPRPEPTEPTGGPPLSAYPVETIEQALLNFVPGPGDLKTSIATKDLVPGVDFRTDVYGNTVESWAAKRAQEIKWGVGGKIPEGYVQPTNLPPILPGMPPVGSPEGYPKKPSKPKPTPDEEWEELRKRLNRPEKITRI